MFKVGDKLKCVRGGGGSSSPNRCVHAGTIYTVKRVNTDNTVRVEELGNYSYIGSRFEYAKCSNEERMRKRMEELNVE